MQIESSPRRGFITTPADVGALVDHPLEGEGWSVATAIFPGRDGEFWLRQAVEGEGQEWVVVRSGSARKWRIMLPERFRLSAIHGGHLYGVARDEFDVASVARIADSPR